VAMNQLDEMTLLFRYQPSVTDVGKIRRHTLAEIFDNILYSEYISYLGILMLDVKAVLNILENDLEIGDKARELEELDIFDLLVVTKGLRELLQDAINFFVDCHHAEFSFKHGAFLIYRNDKDNNLKVDGFLSKDNFDEFRDVVLELNFVKKQKLVNEKNLKFKNETAKRIYESLKQAEGKEKGNKNIKKEDKNLALPNIVSVLSSFSNSTNILTLRNMTVSEVYTLFITENIKRVEEIAARSFSIWGGENYKPADWYKLQK
jgi:hypothetical protein